MSLLLTLITPPDIFENDNHSIFLINLTEKEQDEATKWLSDCTLDIELNIYFYQHEPNVVWFLHAMANSGHKYINLDNTHGMSEMLNGYILSKSSVYYSTSDKNQVAVYSHINQNKVDNIKAFFERVLSENKQ
jgi:hypothetical protein